MLKYAILKKRLLLKAKLVLRTKRIAKSISEAIKNLKDTTVMTFVPPLYAITANTGTNPNAIAEETA
jgi:hypothetical protein